MATNNVEQELLDLERKYWQAIKDNDLNAALELTDETCIVSGAQGVANIDREAFEKMMKAAPWKLDDFELKDDAQVRILGDDVAVLAYNVHEEVTVDGKRLSLDAAESSTWVRRNGSWRCAMHSESIHGDPFGRDKQKKRAPKQAAKQPS